MVLCDFDVNNDNSGEDVTLTRYDAMNKPFLNVHLVGVYTHTTMQYVRIWYSKIYCTLCTYTYEV